MVSYFIGTDYSIGKNSRIDRRREQRAELNGLRAPPACSYGSESPETVPQFGKKDFLETNKNLLQRNRNLLLRNKNLSLSKQNLLLSKRNLLQRKRNLLETNGTAYSLT